MKPRDLVWRGLVFHARAHAATLAGIVVASTVLVGALSVGDSVRASLEHAARSRLGRVDAVLGNGERFFGLELVTRLARRVSGLVLSPAIQLSSVVSTPEGARRAADVQLLGVEGSFFAFAPAPGDGTSAPGPGEAWVGLELARELALAKGADLVLRTTRPSAMTRELALTSVEEAVVPLRVRVARILDDDDFGAFSLETGAGPRSNLFVQRDWLAERLDVRGRANRCFLHLGAPADLAAVGRALRESWELTDVGLSFAAVASVASVASAESVESAESAASVASAGSAFELRSDQVFLAEPIVTALRARALPTLGVLTYFVNELRHGERATPYSTVAALGSIDARPAPDLDGGRTAVASELGADEIVLNDWTARDLAAGVGDEVSLRYYVLGSGRALAEQSHVFRVRAVVPSQGIGADPTLMPDFPGIGDAKNCRDWDPGFPLELEAIRDQDEEYWDLHRGAPKAFVSLATALALWSNRFGSFTALRVPADQAEAVRAVLREGLDPGALGLPLRPVLAGVEASSDFGGLFLGLSFFLIVSALLLTALFFGFSLERRASELGVLRVTGFLPRAVARLQLGETLLLCVAGALLGSGLGIGYTRLLLGALERWWRGAVGRTELLFHVAPATLLLAGGLSIGLALASVLWVLWRSVRVPALRLLWGELVIEAPGPDGVRRRRAWLVLWFAVALGCLGGALGTQGSTSGGLAFGAGVAGLLGGLVLVRAQFARRRWMARSTLALGWSNAGRRPARSLTTVALVASSIFLLVVAGGNRQGPTPGEPGRDSGTGGFDWFGRTGLAVLQDLNAASGREFYGLSEQDCAGVEWVPLRVRAGDEASCLSLDQPKNPRLLGVDPARLAGRFRFGATSRATRAPWTLLEEEPGPDGAVPVIVDAVSLQWTLHKRLGDELDLVDGRGAAFRARVVATLADSILQGDLVLAERNFERLFPDESGHRAFLVDAPAGQAEDVAARFCRALADEGLVLVSTRERLDLLHGVQNTYLAIFQALGGLGLVLGSAGLLALVLRSASERRGELALLRALGFTRAELAWLFLGEHGALLWIGIALGTCAGMCVVLPAGVATLDAFRTLGALIAVVGLLGSVWVWLGARSTLHGGLLAALNRE